MDPNWDDTTNWLAVHGIRILVVIVLGIIGWFLAHRIVPPMVRHSVFQNHEGESQNGLEKRAKTLIGVFMGLTRAVIVLIVLFTSLSEAGIPIAPLLASFGIVGIAVGFGAQYLIRDLIAGFFVLMENQYREGDVAKVADTIGLVEDVNLRKTVLRDLDGIVHHVPNGEIRVASNYTRHFSRVNLDITVAYNTQLEHAIGVINRVGTELVADPLWAPSFKTTPAVLRVNNLGNHGIDIKIMADVLPLEQWRVMGELRLRLKAAFDKEGIEIPWGYSRVFLDNLSNRSNR